MAETANYEKSATKVALVTIVWNIVLSIGKLLAGILAHSGAMISDAVHSASDVFSSIIVIIGVRIASRDSDREHPYGHERLECVASVILATVLCITGIGIGINACKDILGGHYQELAVPGVLALIAALVSIIVKEGMFWYTRHYAKKLDSGALMADAVGTTVGACLGTSTITTFVESSSGIAEGGRTGLTSIVSGLLFILALFFSPIFLAIPSFATAPALIVVGFFMMQSVAKINWSDMLEAIPAFICIFAMPFMYSISEGISFGVISFVVLNAVAGKAKKITPLMWVLAVLFILKYIFL